MSGRADQIPLANKMEKQYLDHPSEEALERFVMHQSQDEEEEVLETHILACESCVTRLEDIEITIMATKLALRERQSEDFAKETAKQGASWKNWFSAPKLAFAGALATVALGVAIAPQIQQSMSPVANVDLTAYRGNEQVVVPENRTIHFHLNGSNLPEGPIAVHIVDMDGNDIWKGSTSLRDAKADVTVPRIQLPGAHLVRMYAAGQDTAGTTPLREFAIDVK